MIARPATATVRVCLAVPGDTNAIDARLDPLAWEGALGVPGAPDRPAQERAALAAAPENADATFAAETETRVAGHLVVVRGRAPHLDHVADLAVAFARRAQRRGLGGTLLDQALPARSAAGSDPKLHRRGPAAGPVPRRGGEPE
ncbi:MAG TPA: GNAT family N-acetyltransferase [Bacillota bacterium]|nr:GNAT family N-acetyltransferase [Bacillota bacterium]